MAVVGSVLDLIGNTPMVDVSALSPNPDVRIVVKLEGQNPGGSVKDRIALRMVNQAVKDGSPRSRAQPCSSPPRAIPASGSPWWRGSRATT